MAWTADLIRTPSAEPNNLSLLNCCKNASYILLGCHVFFSFIFNNITSKNLTLLA